MTCYLTVCTWKGVWQEDVDPWTSLVVLAALSAEPESFTELAEAVRRYQPEHRLFDESRRTYRPCKPEASGPWCVIDLTGRMVVAGNGYELPNPCGAYEADADDHAEGFPIVWLDTPGDWLFQQADDDWEETALARASARRAVQRVDARAVLWGLPLLEHLADNVLTAAADGLGPTRQQERTRAVHAHWLLTARADLGERRPREGAPCGSEPHRP